MQNFNDAYLQCNANDRKPWLMELHDSPVASSPGSWRKFKELTDPEADYPRTVLRDRMLTNISIYWLTGTAHHRLRSTTSRYPRMTGAALVTGALYG